jgi:hypothetical protein
MTTECGRKGKLMELLVLSCIFTIYTIYLFIKPIERNELIPEEEAVSYFFKQSEVVTTRELSGTFTNGIAVYQNKKTKNLRVIKQAKLCDSSLI